MADETEIGDYINPVAGTAIGGTLGDNDADAAKSRDMELKARDLRKRLEIERAEKEAAELASGYRDKGFVYRSAVDKQWRWKRVAANNEIVGASHEGFKAFSDCVKNYERQFIHCNIADVTVEE